MSERTERDDLKRRGFPKPTGVAATRPPAHVDWSLSGYRDCDDDAWTWIDSSPAG